MKELLSLIDNFPVGFAAQNRTEVLSKAAVISYLARFQDRFDSIENIDEREEIVRDFFSSALLLKENEFIPTLFQAEKILKLSSGSLQDFGKVQYIREVNPNFDKTYDFIANNLGLINKISVKRK